LKRGSNLQQQPFFRGLAVYPGISCEPYTPPAPAPLKFLSPPSLAADFFVTPHTSRQDSRLMS
jgi:hypothetical protein